MITTLVIGLMGAAVIIVSLKWFGLRDTLVILAVSGFMALLANLILVVSMALDSLPL